MIPKFFGCLAVMTCLLQIVHIEIIEAKEAVYVELPNDLSKTMKEALKQIGISKLYSHQVLLFFFFFSYPW